MKWLSILLFSFLLSSVALAQKPSKIYDKKGRLIANSSFSIGKKQLNFFIKIQDTLIKQLISNQVEYPEEMREANMSESFIISFEINNEGNFRNIELENIKHARRYDSSTCIRYFLPAISTAFEKIKPLSGKTPAYITNKKFLFAFKFYLTNEEDSAYFSQGLFLIRGKLIPIVRPTTISGHSVDSSDLNLRTSFH